MMEKILNIATIVMFVITVVLLGMFMFGGEIPNQQYPTPVYTASLLNWAYILFAVAAISALIFPAVRLFTRPKEAMKSFIGLLALVVLVLLGYAMADGTPMNIVGYSGPDNVPSRLIFSDTILYTMYFLCIAVVLAIAATEIIRRIR